MGKKKDNKSSDKKAARALKQERKLNKGEKKKSGSSSTSSDDFEDIESIIEEMRSKEAKKTAVHISSCEQPSPRANFSFVSLPNTSGEVLMFGGEYCNGESTQTFNEMYRWNMEKNQWKAIESLNTPAPRCSHQAVYYNEKMYMFGGEYATLDNFHHYRDLWELDIKSNVWREVEASGDCPTARSGHRMVVWRSYIVLFGGFYEAKKEQHWFNDLYFFSLKECKWTKIAYKPLAQVPRVRSGMQMLVGVDDTLFLYGGFSKEKLAIAQEGKKEAHTHDDLWMIDMKPALGAGKGDNEDGEGEGGKKKAGGSSGSAAPAGLDFTKVGWSKLARKGSFPTTRSGAVMAFYKNKGILFGGVHDSEEPRHGLKSVFHDDMYTLDLGTRRWYPFIMNSSGEKEKEGGGGAIDSVFEGLKKASLDEESSDGEDHDSADEGEREGRVSKSKARPYPRLEEFNDLTGIDSSYVTTYFKERYKESPCPRINPAMVVRGSKLYLYGGVCELSDIEVALDDCWVVDLVKREGWRCLIEGTMSRFVWKGAITEGTEGTLSDEEEEEEEEEAEEDRGRRKAKGAALKEEDSDDNDDDDGEEADGDGLGEAPAAIAGESLREYYARSAEFWTRLADVVMKREEQEEAGGTAKLSGKLTEKQQAKRLKEVRKRAFLLCEEALA